MMTNVEENAASSDKVERLDAEKDALAERVRALQDANRRLTEENARLQRLALYDTQTGLGNRDLFLRQLDHLIAIASRRDEEVALLEFDLDGFKAINDRLGHAAGDEILREIGARLQETLRKSDQKFRIGGDEFAVLLEPRPGASDGALIVAEQIARSLMNPIEIRGEACKVGVSIGIAVFPEHGRESSTLLRKADAAMYEAKKKQLVVAGASDLGATTVLKRLQSDLFQLIYVSTAVSPMKSSDLVSLMLQARDRNERLQLTGMLLYKSGRFMGALEGDEASVRRVFADIQKDGRHRNLDILRSKPILERDFPSWTMGFERFDLAAVPAFTSFLDLEALPEHFEEETVEAHAMLLAFRRATLTPPFDEMTTQQPQAAQDGPKAGSVPSA